MKSAWEMIVSASALLMGLQILKDVIGLMKQVVITSHFGTSDTMDGYFVANTLVAVILVWLSQPLDRTIIPIFRYDLTQRGEQVAWANFSTLFNNLVPVFIFIAIAGWFAAPYLVALMAPGFERGTGALATSLSRITMASVVFGGLGHLLSQIFFSYKRFLLPGIVGSADNVVVLLAFLALSGTYGIYGLATAVVLGAFCRFALQCSILWEKRQFYCAKVDPRHPGMLEMGKLSFPLMISASTTEVARITDRIFASLLPAGSLSALALARGLIDLPMNLCIGSLQKATFPHFTELSAEEKFQKLSRQLFRYLCVVFCLALPIAIGIMALAEPIVRVLYQRGAFDETSVRLTSQALFFYAIGFPALATSRILARTFFGLKDTWTPSKIALLCMGIKIVLAWVLIRPLGHLGIALAESLSQITKASLLFFFLPDQVKREEGWNTVKSLGRTLATSILMLAVIYLVKDRIAGLISIPLELAVLILLGFATYVAIAFLFRGEEIQSLVKALRALGAKLIPTKS